MSDLVVVGGGIVGLTAAYEASRLGARVTIVDVDYAGRATDAGAGIVNPLDLVGEQSAAERARVGLSGPAYYGDLLSQLAEDGETDHGYARVGQLVVGADDGALDRLVTRLSTMDLGGAHRVAASAAAAMVPYLVGEVRAALLPDVARVDGRKLRTCLINAGVRRGIGWRHGVGRVVTKSDAVVGVEVDGERIDTERIVVAAGAWPVADLPPLDAITPVRGQIVHLRYPGGQLATTPVVSKLDGPYILGFDPDRVVTGATHERVGFDYRVTAGGLAEILSAAVRLAPGLADAQLIETRVGFRPVSRDGLPVLGPVPGLPGAVMATGLGAHGLTLGPVVGAIAARIALGERPGADISDVLPDRFAA